MILRPLENHWHRTFSASADSLVIPWVILKNDLKIYVFLAAVESVVAVAVVSAVASVVASAVTSRFKDPALDQSNHLQIFST